MKTLRTAFILAVATVVFKMIGGGTWHESSYVSDDKIDKMLKDIDVELPSDQTSSHNTNYTSNPPPFQPSLKPDPRFTLLDNESIEAFFAKQKDTRNAEVYIRRDKRSVEATLYRLDDNKSFELASQAAAYYLCQTLSDQAPLTLEVKNTIDDRMMRYELNDSFCSSPSRHLPLLNQALDSVEFDIRIVNQPPHHPRLWANSVTKLYQTDSVKLDIVSWLKEAALNARYFVFLDDNGQLRYYDGHTKTIGQLPDWQKRFIPTAFALEGDHVYVVDHVLYEYDLKAHRYRAASEPIGWAERMAIVGDTIYLLHEANEGGWYLFAYGKDLTFRYAMHCPLEFRDMMFQGNAIVARDAKHWYRFDLRSGRLSATQANANLIIATSDRYIIDQKGIVYDTNLTQIATLQPPMHVSDAAFGHGIVFAQNLEQLAVYDTKTFHRKAVIENHDDYIAASNRLFAATAREKLRDRIDMFDAKLQKVDRLFLTHDSRHRIAVSPSYAAFGIDDALLVLDTDTLRVRRVLSVPSESDAYVLKGSMLYYQDESKQWQRLDIPKGTRSLTSERKIDPVSKHLGARNRFGDTIRIVDKEYLEIRNAQQTQRYWIGFCFDPKVAATDHYGLLFDRDTIYRIDFNNPRNVMRIQAVAPEDGIYDIELIDDDTVMILSKYALSVIDIGKPCIIVSRSKSDIVASIKD